MDITVAIITTVFVGFLLFIITTITILPAINRTFPYKSPVAWGFWKLMIVTTSFVRTRRKLSSSTILPVIVPSEESSTAPHEGKQDRMSTTWQKRDLDHSKMEEQQHLWMLLRWFCSEWSDHRLAPVVQRCMRDLVYGENAQSTQYHNYVDLIQTSVPALLNLSSSKMWPLLISTCGLPSELLHAACPQALTVSMSDARALKEQIKSLPWKMLAMISDEMIVCLRVAITADLTPDIYDLDKSRTLAFSGLCFLLCMFEPATAAGMGAPFLETWLALFCDICCHHQSTSLVHFGRHPETHMAWTLEDIVFPWFERLPLGTVSQNNALRMLHTLRIRFPQLLLDGERPLGTYEMKMFATLSSKALKVVIDNKYVSNATAPDAATNTPMSVTPVDSAVMRVCRMIERSTYIAEKENMTNCGMKDFPWLKELVPFAIHLTRDCRVRIASGFQTGLFTASDKTSQAALMQALIIAGPLEPKGPTNSITPKSILKTSLPPQTTEVPSHQSRSKSPSPVIGTPPVLAATTSSPYNHSPPSMASWVSHNPQHDAHQLLHEAVPVPEHPQRRDTEDTEATVMSYGHIYSVSNEWEPIYAIVRPPWNPEDHSALRALHDYFARDSTELTFKAGDIIKVLEESSNRWWKGALGNQTGFFPMDLASYGVSSHDYGLPMMKSERKTARLAQIVAESPVGADASHGLNDYIHVSHNIEPMDPSEERLPNEEANHDHQLLGFEQSEPLGFVPSIDVHPPSPNFDASWSMDISSTDS